ncbi:energy-coupling factor transporter ATPase [Clostridium sp. UBA4395]|uniref:ABC transporter ATP-binding protein n=1 Tax=Clostridium sp. UBA4395 TaxID=1946360 RepID=UPI0032171482
MEDKNCIIEIKDLTFSYPLQQYASLNNINLSIEEGEFIVFCGKSGCGKSTLLRHLKSVLEPHGKRCGKVLYYSTQLSQVSERTQSAEIGFVLQNPDNQIVTDKVWHELAFGLESLGYDTQTIRLRVAEMASYFGIQQWFMRDVRELSGGQKQLLNLASIMAMHPKVLILDEPTSQLDPIAASDFLETVKKINRDIGTTIILTEHRLEDVIPFADRVYVMENGQILTEGTPREIGERLKELNNDMFVSMPTPMQIYTGVNNDYICPLTVREGRRWIDNIVKNKKSIDLKKIEETRVSRNSIKMKSNIEIPAIKVKDVWFRYGKDMADVVKDLSMEVKTGEFFALLGGNGTGKSTTLSMLARIRFPYRGKIWLDGKALEKYTDNELYNGFLGVLPQNPQSLFVKNTVEEDLYEMIDGRKQRKSDAYPIDMKKEDVIKGIISLTKLEGLMNRHPYDLSGGEQQRLALAKVLLLRPKILLMDEPTKGLDNYYKQEFGKILKKLTEHGVTILLISHDVEFCAQYADRVGLFFEGHIVSTSTAKEFFAGNSFYTTAANRMARKHYPEAVTVKDVIECLGKKL